ncbi:hypothetical protein LguiA_010043 [Lonicera macranthoides]
MVSGIPIPSHLLLSVKRSLDSSSSSSSSTLFARQPIGWGMGSYYENVVGGEVQGQYYGRKIDPEPGRPLPSSFSSSTNVFNSGSYSQADKDYRYLQGGMREDERDFFPGSVRNLLHHHEYSYPKTLTMTSSRDRSDRLHFQSLVDKSNEQQKQLAQQEQHCFIMGADFKSVASRSIEEEEEEEKIGETTKPFHHFLGEWKPNKSATWLDIDHHQHNHASSSVSSATQLSISMPLSAQDLFQSNPTSYWCIAKTTWLKEGWQWLGKGMAMAVAVVAVVVWFIWLHSVDEGSEVEVVVLKGSD